MDANGHEHLKHVWIGWTNWTKWTGEFRELREFFSATDGQPTVNGLVTGTFPARPGRRLISLNSNQSEKSQGTVSAVLERFKKYCSHAVKWNEGAVFLGYGCVSAQSQGYFEPAPSPKLRPKPERFSCLCRACSIFLRKDFVVRRLQIHGGYARASLLALRKNLLRNHFPPNRIVPAKSKLDLPTKILAPHGHIIF